MLKEAAASYFGVIQDKSGEIAEARKFADDLVKDLKKQGFKPFFTWSGSRRTSHIIQVAKENKFPVIAEISILGKTERFNESKEYDGSALTLTVTGPTDTQPASITIDRYNGCVKAYNSRLGDFLNSNSGGKGIETQFTNHSFQTQTYGWEQKDVALRQIVEFLDKNTDAKIQPSAAVKYAL